MHFTDAAHHAGRFLGFLFLAASAIVVPSAARAQSDESAVYIDPNAVLQLKVAQLFEGVNARFSPARLNPAHPAEKANRGGKGSRVERTHSDIDGDAVPAEAPRVAHPDGALSVLVIPTNVRANDKTGDAGSAGQSEVSIAMNGQYGLCAWNNGQGFNTGGDLQGVAYTTDGGATWLPTPAVPPAIAGAPPHFPGSPGRTWTSDPACAVNEKTGEFYYCGLINDTGTTNGVGVVRGTFSGTTFTWDTPRVVASGSNTLFGYDKEWIAADSSTGNLYVSYTLFEPATDNVKIQRSTNNGVSWDPPITLNAPAAAGLVQGSRPAVGPNGEVYVVWSEIGATADFMRIARSTNAGVSYGAQMPIASEYSNFGTGAPGYNRSRGITFPSIAVDRTAGPNRGRFYVAWNEAVDWYDDLLGGGGNQNEIENDNFFSRATPFTPGQRLWGAIQTSGDLDYWSFSATQGVTYIFVTDSLRTTMLYSMRIFCTDSTTRLAFGGDLLNQGRQGYIVWTAPTTGTYYLRFAPGSTGGYRCDTGVAAASLDDRARDHRDILVTHSDDGAAWSTPTQANDDPAYFDDWLPEVTVGPDGCPYVLWYDWRDATSNCGGSSHIYLSRSGDGGTTWEASQRTTTATTAWTTTASNIAPNQGDYQSFTSDARYLRPAWADGRSGDADVWTTGIDTYHDLSLCQADTVADNNTSVVVSWTVSNLNPLFANDYTYVLTSDRGWPLPPSGGLNVGASSSAPIALTVDVPDSAAAGVSQLCLAVTNAKGTLTRQCCFDLTVNHTVGVGPQALEFGLTPNAPNPGVGWTRIGFALPSAAPVTLRIYGLRGERVRTLVDGVQGPGLHSVVWDGRDDRGRPVGGGAYFYRLEGLGRSATRRLVLMP